MCRLICDSGQHLYQLHRHDSSWVWWLFWGLHQAPGQTHHCLVHRYHFQALMYIAGL